MGGAGLAFLGPELDVLERGKESEITFKHIWVFAYVNIWGKYPFGQLRRILTAGA